MRINYLVDTIARDYVPLDVEKINQSPIQYFVPITDVETGRHRFVGGDMWFNPYEVTRAATAIPILYNGHVRLGSHAYLDGDFTTSMATLLRKALDEGARRIICVTNTNAPGRMAKIFFKVYAAFLHPNLRTMFLNDLETTGKLEWPDDIEFVCISPTFPLPAVIYSRNRREIIESFNMGYDDLMARREDIERLLQS
jgi:predicted patatin/cPLA2 family phospholipase